MAVLSVYQRKFKQMDGIRLLWTMLKSFDDEVGNEDVMLFKRKQYVPVLKKHSLSFQGDYKLRLGSVFSY